jgi:hypothetical protein
VVGDSKTMCTDETWKRFLEHCAENECARVAVDRPGELNAPPACYAFNRPFQTPAGSPFQPPAGSPVETPAGSPFNLKIPAGSPITPFTSRTLKSIPAGSPARASLPWRSAM